MRAAPRHQVIRPDDLKPNDLMTPRFQMGPGAAGLGRAHGAANLSPTVFVIRAGGSGGKLCVYGLLLGKATPLAAELRLREVGSQPASRSHGPIRV